MKILLSPLFFRQTFCKHCVRIFYKEHPDKWIWQHELERMPPLGRFEARTGFVPDLALLTMFDEFIIDAQAHDRILDHAAPSWLGPWPEVLEMLGSEGALTVIDTDQEAKEVAAIRGAMLKQDMQKPAEWFNAMTYHDTLMWEAERALGDKVDSAGNLSWKFDKSKMPGTKGSDGQYHLLSNSLLVESEDDPDDPHYKLRQEALINLGRQLREVNAGLAVTKLIDAAPMFWAPYKGYLKTKAEGAAVALDTHNQAEASRLFFQIAFPQYKPESVRDIRRLRQDKRLKQLREEIIIASRTGDVFDPEYPQKVLREVVKVEKRTERVRQISGWLSSLIGSVPLPGAGLAGKAMSELITRRAKHKHRQDWNWFYLISDGTGCS